MKNLAALHTTMTSGALVLLLAGMALVSAAEPEGDDVLGIWLGVISVNEETKLRVAFEITEDESGALQATFASVDQNAFGIPVKSVTYEKGKLTLDVTAIGGVYEGTRLDGTTIAGKLRQGDREPTQLDLKKVDVMPAPGLKRPRSRRSRIHTKRRR